MQLLRTDANLGSQTELSAIGETGGSVVIDTGCINAVKETIGNGFVLSDYTLAMSGAEDSDVVDGLV